MSFRQLIEAGRVKTMPLPARSPNLNAYAERWVRIGETGMPVEAHLVRGEAAAPSPAAICGPLPRGAQSPGQANYETGNQAFSMRLRFLTIRDVLVGTDFFTVEVLTLKGLVTYYVLFFIQLESRRVCLAGITPHPDQQWMEQMGAT